MNTDHFKHLLQFTSFSTSFPTVGCMHANSQLFHPCSICFRCSRRCAMHCSAIHSCAAISAGGKSGCRPCPHFRLRRRHPRRRSGCARVDKARQGICIFHLAVDPTGPLLWSAQSVIDRRPAGPPPPALVVECVQAGLLQPLQRHGHAKGAWGGAAAAACTSGRGSRGGWLGGLGSTKAGPCCITPFCINNAPTGGQSPLAI